MIIPSTYKLLLKEHGLSIVLMYAVALLLTTNERFIHTLILATIIGIPLVIFMGVYIRKTRLKNVRTKKIKHSNKR